MRWLWFLALLSRTQKFPGITKPRKCSAQAKNDATATVNEKRYTV
jgi:hypothetical protein